jgi:hypothetical protein
LLGELRSSLGKADTELVGRAFFRVVTQKTLVEEVVTKPGQRTSSSSK